MRTRPHAVVALLLAAFLLLPAYAPAQEPPPADALEAVVEPLEATPAGTPETPPAEARPAADDAGEEPAPEPVSEEAGSGPEQSEAAEGGPPPAEPAPPTLAGMHGDLLAALTAEAANQVTVDAATEALGAARQALTDAEAAHAAAMSDQGTRSAGVREAAQALVDFLTAAYLQ